MSADLGYKYVPIRLDSIRGLQLTKCQNGDCRSSDIFAGHFESDTTEAWRDVECYECGAKWVEVYKFNNVERLQVKIHET